MDKLDKQKDEPQDAKPDLVTDDPIERFVSVILNNQTIKTLVENWTTNEQKVKTLDNENNSNFWNFLKKIDIFQKIYNIIFVCICSIIIWKLKSFTVIGQETAQTLLTLVIGIGISNAISSFFKSSKK